MFRYASPEAPVLKNHPLRMIRSVLIEQPAHADRKLEKLRSRADRSSTAW